VKSGRSLVAVSRSKPGTRNSAFELKDESFVSKLAEEIETIGLRPSAKLAKAVRKTLVDMVTPNKAVWRTKAASPPDVSPRPTQKKGLIETDI